VLLESEAASIQELLEPPEVEDLETLEVEVEVEPVLLVEAGVLDEGVCVEFESELEPALLVEGI
jgi:hypothetical protein